MHEETFPTQPGDRPLAATDPLLLEAFFDHAPEMMGVVEIMDGDIRHLADNAAAARFLGLPPGSMAGRQASELGVPAEVLALWLERFRESERTGRAVQFEYSHPTPDGARCLLASVSPLSGSAPAHPRFRYVVEDVTEVRHREKEALRVTEEKLAKSFSSNPSAIALTRVDDGRFAEVNESWVSILGYSREEAIGRTSQELGIWPDAASRARFVAELRRTGSIRGWEERFLNKAGVEFVALLSAEALTVGGEGMVLSTFLDITARKRAEEALRESTALLQAIGDSTGDVIFAKDRHGRFTYANPATLMLIGKTLVQVLGRTDAEVLEDKDAARTVMGNDDRIMANGAAEDVEEVVPLPDGTRRIWFSRKTPFRDGNGDVAGLLGVSRDITDSKRAEEALKQSEERFRTLADNMSQLAWMADADGKVFWFNKRWFEYTGLPEDQPAAYDRRRVLHPDHLERVLDHWNRSRVTGEPWEDTYPMRGKDGDYRWFLSRALPVRGDDGSIVRWFGTNTDITTRLEMEDDLRRSHERLRTLIEASPIGVVVGDVLGRIYEANDACLDIIGFTRDEMEAGLIRWETLTPAEWLPADAKAIEEARATGATPHYEKEFVRRDGSRVAVYIGLAVVGEAREECVAFIADITERKRMEDEIRARNEALAAADRAKDDFLAMLAHELRNPLAAISTAGALIELRADGIDSLRKPVEIVNRQVKHTARLVDDLLDVSRITRGKLELRRERLDLTEAARRAAETARPQMDVARHTFTVSIPRGPMWLEGDAARMEQIVGNLLNNAAKYTDPGGHVALSVAQNDDEAVIRVRDNGHGIEPEMLGRIFDMFAQEERSLARSKGGLGIGLTLVEKLVQMHSGSVAARSEGPGHGSEFVVRLPLLEGAAPEPEGRGNGPAGCAGCRVLVVEDNVDAAAALADLLEAFGQEVTTVHDGPTALEAAAQVRPDLVLLDIGLPVMDGYEVARALRGQASTADARIVALTGYGQEADRRRAREAGFDAHLVKPVDLERLKGLLDETEQAIGPGRP